MTAKLILLGIVFVGAVRSDENKTVVSENPDIAEVHTTYNKSEDYNADIQNQEASGNPQQGEVNATKVKVVDINQSSETNRSRDKVNEEYSDDAIESKTPVEARRILNGRKVERGARPYMVYLQSTEKSKKKKGWMCGGVVVHKEYVITSAACVEEMERFYVISGTNKKSRNEDDECVRQNKRKVIWKCVPKSYKFDYFTASWSVNDIAVVKVDIPFKLGKVEDGCHFAVETVVYNNISRQLEEPSTKGYVLGWGSAGKFSESVYRRNIEYEYEYVYETDNGDVYEVDEGTGQYEDAPSLCLQEAEVRLMDKEKCANQWPREMREMIEDYMICTEDIDHGMSRICSEKYANCTVVSARRMSGNQTVEGNQADEGNLTVERNQLIEGNQTVEGNQADERNLTIERNQTIEGNQTVERNQTKVMFSPSRRITNSDYITTRRTWGGFCENDHGGPLVVRYRGKDHVVGVISASKVDSSKSVCQGPFLYTSVFKNRQFLSCAIHKDIDADCRRVFRTGVSYREWTVDWGDKE